MGNNMPCPTCQTPIPFDSKGLMEGKQYTCSNCDTKIGLSKEGYEVVKNTMDQFESLKKNVEQK